MTLNIENLVRSAAIVAVGLPVTLALASSVGTANKIQSDAAAPNARKTLTEGVKTDLTKPCLNWVFADVDSKLEKSAESDIEEYWDGDVDIAETCKWVLS